MMRRGQLRRALGPPRSGGKEGKTERKNEREKSYKNQKDLRARAVQALYVTIGRKRRKRCI